MDRITAIIAILFFSTSLWAKVDPAEEPNQDRIGLGNQPSVITSVYTAFGDVAANDRGEDDDLVTASSEQGAETPFSLRRSDGTKGPLIYPPGQEKKDAGQ